MLYRIHYTFWSNPAPEGSFISYTSLYRGVSVINPCIYPIDQNTLYWQSSRQTFNKLDISWVEVKFSYIILIFIFLHNISILSTHYFVHRKGISTDVNISTSNGLHVRLYIDNVYCIAHIKIRIINIFFLVCNQTIGYVRYLRVLSKGTLFLKGLFIWCF